MGRRRDNDPADLTDEQRAELLDLDPRQFGPWIFVPELSFFRSEEEKRQAWEANVSELTEEYARRWPGQRPAAWWTWSAPPDAPSWREVIEQPPHKRHQDVQAAYLEEHGLLFTFEVGAWQGRP